ncbi:MAG: radical SAM family heme chaperone HemW [Pirellulaceae bacterium]
MRNCTPRSVYIHIPFCRHHCEYCNFTVVAGREYLIDQFLQALAVELQQLDGRPELDTLYLGGGTPSRLPAPALAALLDLICGHFELAAAAEFTIEANPEDLPGEIGQVIDDSRINRISLGIQSFDSQKRQRLDRDHSDIQIANALDFCRQHTRSFSIDLIFAAPADNPGMWQADLQQAIHCGAHHVSTYELTIEKGTRFWNRKLHGQLQTADDEQCAALFETTIATLTDSGFEHYEVSSFARPGFRSRHNQIYWTGRSYWAFGPGACGLVDGRRFTNHRSTTRYLKAVLSGQPAFEEEQHLSAREMAQERIVFGLRMTEGIDLNAFREETRLAENEVVPSSLLNELQDQGLIEFSPQRLKLTSRGLLFGDLVCSRIHAAEI